MKRWTVCYTEKRIMEIIVEANNQGEAEDIVYEGGADYNSAIELDAWIASINKSEFLDNSEVSEGDE